MFLLQVLALRRLVVRTSEKPQQFTLCPFSSLALLQLAMLKALLLGCLAVPSASARLTAHRAPAILSASPAGLRGGRACATVVEPSAEPLLRIGHGYDIHRMASREEAGQPVIIGGVKFDGSDAPDFNLGCVAHSDGDVVYHSVTDAILGALSMPDIGQLFPDNDPRLKGADSEVFMEEAYERMVGRGYRVGNVDVTVICQKPRINVEHAGGQVKARMSANLARLLRVPLGRVNVKARTHELVDSVRPAGGCPGCPRRRPPHPRPHTVAIRRSASAVLSSATSSS